MQLILKNLLLICLAFGFFKVSAQNSSSSTSQSSDTTLTKEAIRLEDIDISFLSSYYQQDGNNSPVTGGEGTEFLDNIAPSLVVNIPVSKRLSFNANLGIDVYSSASSDNINNPYLLPDHVSSASAQDIRYYGNFGTQIKSKKLKNKYGIDFGFSTEFDVLSFSGGLSFSRSFAKENQTLDVKLKYFYDDWKLIYPVEFRNGNQEYLDTDIRHSVSGSITFSSILHRRMQGAIIGDFVFQTGLLSTPFHRVYFQDSNLAGIEKTPSTRIKIPIGLRLNYHILAPVIVRLYYRFYYDTWNVIGNTIQVEFPIKIAPAFRLYPSYRFHHQTSASFFRAKGEHLTTDSFYSSDYDLSGFMSHQIGLGFKIMPVNGLFSIKSKNAKTYFKDIELKYSYFLRTDGLNAHTVTALLHFAVSRSAKKKKVLKTKL